MLPEKCELPVIEVSTKLLLVVYMVHICDGGNTVAGHVHLMHIPMHANSDSSFGREIHMSNRYWSQ
jgi:hypothetical protein